MKRYIPITLESEPSVIGINNGVYQCEIKPNKFNNKNGFLHLERFYDGYKFDAASNRRIEGNIEIEYCRLLKKAYLTNFMSYSPNLFGCHFIIDEKAYNILHGFEFGKFSKFIPLKLYDNKGQYVNGKYYLLFQDLILNSCVDFKNSLFYTGHKVTGDRKNISFNNPKEYKKELFVNTEQIVLNEKFDDNLDFFTPRIDTRFFISENLMAEIERNGLTGISRTKQINEITVANKA